MGEIFSDGGFMAGAAVVLSVKGAGELRCGE